MIKKYTSGRDFIYEYDDRGNLISTTTPDGDKFTYGYDERGNLILSVDPNGNKYVYEYDELGNKISVTYPDGDKFIYGYDDRGVGWQRLNRKVKNTLANRASAVTKFQRHFSLK